MLNRYAVTVTTIIYWFLGGLVNAMATPAATVPNAVMPTATTGASLTGALRSKKNTTYKGYNKEELLYLYTADGIVRIKLLPEVAPQHVERIKLLAREGFYDGMPVHRVIKGFMAQMGDPSGSGSGKSPLPDLAAEINDQRHIRGAVSMARASELNSANSQFFIVTKDSDFLDGQYTVFGFVIEGMEIVDKFKAGTTENNGMVDNPTIINRVRVGSDTKD